MVELVTVRLAELVYDHLYSPNTFGYAQHTKRTMARPASSPLAFDKVRETPVLSDRYATQIVKAEKLEGQDEGWRTLWLAIAGVMAITLGWNVLMLSLNGISY